MSYLVQLQLPGSETRNMPVLEAQPIIPKFMALICLLYPHSATFWLDCGITLGSSGVFQITKNGTCYIQYTFQFLPPSIAIWAHVLSLFEGHQLFSDGNTILSHICSSPVPTNNKPTLYLLPVNAFGGRSKRLNQKYNLRKNNSTKVIFMPQTVNHADILWYLSVHFKVNAFHWKQNRIIH